VITRAVGTSERLDIDIDVFDVRVGDQFLLCSDGLYNSVGHELISQNLRENSLDISVNTLMQTALNNLASDNVSVILVKGVHQNVSA
jgi:serine/threonine protein phosphatase PrpC